MREIECGQITGAVKEALLKAGVTLPPDVAEALRGAAGKETGRASHVLSRCLENLKVAEEENLPICQDTGMVLFFCEIGRDVRLDGSLDGALHKAVEEAYDEGFFRKSVVLDPCKDRKNSGNNLPPVIYHELVEGNQLKINLLLKGFGSENCSRVHMLKPTGGREAVIDAVLQTVREGGGSPCPPIVVGIGLGGTMDKAAVLSKKALCRSLDSHHPDPWYDDLEKELLAKINETGIGGGGLGGDITALGVKIATYPTHIAGMPLAITIQCWADRKAEVIL
ncbi:MAG: fumarate hydratase [Spirochaetales bacterium]|nr:fumarate hydratase [Spirochaetales bacterium]